MSIGRVRFVDSHCHLDNEQYAEDRAAVIQRALDAGVGHFLAIGTGDGPPDLEAGVRIYEYKPAMTHAKVLIVDELWVVLGTTNIDNRSFEHNDEINVAMRDPEVAARLLTDYERDLGESDEVTFERWRRRPLWEKVVGPFIWILERQQ